MSNQRKSNDVSSTGGEVDTYRSSGWTTETNLVREFDRPVDVADAVIWTLVEATERWSKLSETPPLHHFVNAEQLNGLFKTKATDDGRYLPSAEFRFQSCRVTLLYGPSIRVIVERNR